MGDLEVWRAKGIQAGSTVFHRPDTGPVDNRQPLEYIGRCAQHAGIWFLYLRRYIKSGLFSSPEERRSSRAKPVSRPSGGKPNGEVMAPVVISKRYWKITEEDIIRAQNDNFDIIYAAVEKADTALFSFPTVRLWMILRKKLSAGCGNSYRCGMDWAAFAKSSISPRRSNCL